MKNSWSSSVNLWPVWVRAPMVLGGEGEREGGARMDTFSFWLHSFYPVYVPGTTSSLAGGGRSLLKIGASTAMLFRVRLPLGAGFGTRVEPEDCLEDNFGALSFAEEDRDLGGGDGGGPKTGILTVGTRFGATGGGGGGASEGDGFKREDTM